MKVSLFVLIIILSILAVSGTSADSTAVGDSGNGKVLFEHNCTICHSLSTNKMGPMLAGVYGRKSGAVPGFNYSKAVQDSNITWSAGTIDQWLSGPQKLIPGTKMSLIINDAQKRADIIAYLKASSEPLKNKK